MKQHTFTGDMVPARINLEQLTIDIAGFLGKPTSAIQVSASGGGTVRKTEGGKETVLHYEPHITVHVPFDVAHRRFEHIVKGHNPPHTDHEAVVAKERDRKAEEARSLLNSPEFVTILKEALRSHD
jgi:hypothetical protein